MLLDYHQKRLFDGDIAIFHPTLLDSLYIQANCNDLYCNHDILKEILSQLQAKPVNLPHAIKSLGHIHYRGDISGRLEHTDLHGIFTSQLGAVKVNGLLETDTALQDFKWCGHVSTSEFNVGEMLNNPDLGKVAFQAHVDGKLDSLQFTHCIADANIDAIEYQNYTYKNIHFDGEMNKKDIKGLLNIQDENVTLNIDGLIDWSAEDTRLDITAKITDFRPSAVHLIDQYSDMVISAKTYINLHTSGSTRQMLDNLAGYIIVDTLALRNGEKQVVMDQMKIMIDSNQKNKKNHRQLYIQSDFLTANFSGEFQYTTLPNTLQQFIYNYLPALVDKPSKQNKKPNKIT